MFIAKRNECLIEKTLRRMNTRLLFDLLFLLFFFHFTQPLTSTSVVQAAYRLISISWWYSSSRAMRKSWKNKIILICVHSFYFIVGVLKIGLHCKRRYINLKVIYLNKIIHLMWFIICFLIYGLLKRYFN